MSYAIPKGTTTAAEKGIDFYVGTLADPFVPKTSGVAGVNPRLSFGGGAVETGDNTITAISAADGWYRYILSDNEANNNKCTASLFLNEDDIADIAPVLKEFQIGPATMNTDSESKEEIADEVNRRGIGIIKSIKRTGTNGNTGITMTGPDGAATGTLDTNAGALPIVEVDTAT